MMAMLASLGRGGLPDWTTALKAFCILWASNSNCGPQFPLRRSVPRFRLLDHLPFLRRPGRPRLSFLPSLFVVSAFSSKSLSGVVAVFYSAAPNPRSVALSLALSPSQVQRSERVPHFRPLSHGFGVSAAHSVYRLMMGPSSGQREGGRKRGRAMPSTVRHPTLYFPSKCTIS